MGDLAVYRVGSLALAHGRELYSVVGGPEHLHFTYPPFAAAAFAPLAVVPWWLDRIGLAVATVACYGISLRIVIGRLSVDGLRCPSWWLPVTLSLAIWLEPFRTTVSFGQINVLLMTLILVDLLALSDDRKAGWLTGAAAAIKLTPLAFVPYLFACGRRGAGANALKSFAVCAAVGFVADPAASVAYWGGTRFLEPHRVGRVENASNQSVRGILARLFRTTQPPWWWLVVAALIFLSGLAIAAALHRRGRQVESVTTMAIAMLCASPVSWSHHWVWSAPMLVVGADLIRRHRSALDVAIVVAALLPFFLGLVFWSPHASHLELHDSAIQELGSSTYVLGGVLLVAGCCRAGGRRKRGLRRSVVRQLDGV